MKLIKEINEEVTDRQTKKDVEKLVAQYKEVNLTKDGVRSHAGDDLEMLDYSPDEIEKLVPEILKAFQD